MVIKRTPVQPVKVEQQCDCGEGTMIRHGGTVLLSHPPLYQHKCTSCGKEDSFRVSYPYLEYVPLTPPPEAQVMSQEIFQQLTANKA